MRGGPETADIQYVVLPDSTDPYLLARVRWPDVSQAISAGRPYWQDDPGLFDLPYDSSSARVTPGQAASIAARWGAQLISDEARSAPPVIRRMPANWSNLTPAERHAWALEHIAERRARTSPFGRLRSRLRARNRPARTVELEPAARTTSVISVPANERPTEGRTDLAVEDRRRLSTAAVERRRHPRVDVYGTVQFAYGHRVISAYLVNFSQGGMHCVLPDAQSLVELGGVLDSPLLLEDDASKCRIALDVASNVTWHRDIGPGNQIGVAFAQLNDEQVERAQRFLVMAGAQSGA